ncbi:MAG: hypothetical protein ACLUE8_18645 [Lachnospiraceae bacterium]
MHYEHRSGAHQAPVPLGQRGWARRGNKRPRYHLGYFLISTMEKYYLDDWRKEHGLPPRKLENKASYELNGHTIPVLYALSPLVMPRPADWGANIHMTGYWLADNPQEYTPEPGLQQFLSEGGKPIYVGFGSHGQRRYGRNAGDRAGSPAHERHSGRAVQGLGRRRTAVEPAG